MHKKAATTNNNDNNEAQNVTLRSCLSRPHTADTIGRSQPHGANTGVYGGARAAGCAVGRGVQNGRQPPLRPPHVEHREGDEVLLASWHERGPFFRQCSRVTVRACDRTPWYVARPASQRGGGCRLCSLPRRESSSISSSVIDVQLSVSGAPHQGAVEPVPDIEHAASPLAAVVLLRLSMPTTSPLPHIPSSRCYHPHDYVVSSM